MEFEVQYAFPDSPTVFCNPIKLLFVLGPRMQCSGIQCSQPCSQWVSLHRPQIAQLMLMVVYHPAASQIACEVGRRALGRGNIGSLFDCIKALGAYTLVVSDSFRCLSS